jgi:multiple sugar transport system ATP-binding protein
MNLVEAQVDGRDVQFGNLSLPLPDSSPLLGAQRRVILGIRPTDFEHPELAGPEMPRLTVRPDIVEDLGSESHLIFTVDAPRVTAEAVRAATEAAADEGVLFADDQRASFTACLTARRELTARESVELAVDARRLYFFDPGTGLALNSPTTA